MTRPGIYGFQGPHRYLSNFYIEPDGTCVEIAFQAAKCAEASQRRWFEGVTPTQAKAIGRKVVLRPDWEEVKVDIMLFHVTKKFKDHRELQLKLLSTIPLYLEETNHWGDTFWGVCNGRGQNILGHILMQVREELLK